MDNYSKIFVYASLSAADLASRLSSALARSPQAETNQSSQDFEAVELALSVLPNDDYDETYCSGGSGDFVYFPLMVEVEAASEPMSAHAYQSSLTKVLAALDSLGTRFVTSSDHEEFLPGGGANTSWRELSE